MQYYTPKQIAIMLQVNEITVRRWLRFGKLEGHRLDRRLWRVSELQLDEFLQRGTLTELGWEK